MQDPDQSSAGLADSGGAQGPRRHILDVARGLLVAEGAARLTMRGIAHRAGCSATALYRYFDSKDALVHALIEEGMELLHEALRSAVRAGDDAAPRVRALCRAYIRFGLEHAEYYEIMFMLHTEHMQRFPTEKYRQARRSLELLVDVLDEGRRAGSLAVSNVRTAASAVWATVHGAVSLLLTHRLDVHLDPNRFVEACIDQVLNGLTSPAPEPVATAPPP